MELCLIWAQGPNREIGRDNALPWRLPEDLAHFKATTLGSPVIMGRRTFESLPNGALLGRLNIVLTRGGVQFPGAFATADLSQALALAGTSSPARVFVIGGAAVYEAALKVADTVYLTRVNRVVPDADAFAPELPSSFQLAEGGDWLTSRTGIEYRFERWAARR